MSESIELILEQLDELEEQERHIKEADFEIEKLKTQLQQKENIIKEVREYIEKYINRDFFDLENSGEINIKLEIKGLLEILDKVGSDKE